MSHPPVILFDFDGVIITQKALEYTALISLRNKFYKWSNAEDLRLIDYARIFEESDSSNKLKAFRQINKAYKPYISSIWRRIIFFIRFRRTYPTYEKYETLKPNLEDILIQLKKMGICLGIVSNTSKKRLDKFRKELRLDRFFSIFISRDDTPLRKPTPYPIIIALIEIKKKFNYSINREDVYYVGDLPADIECAKNADVKSIALLSGHGTKVSLEKANPTYIIENVKNIMEIDKFKKFLLN